MEKKVSVEAQIGELEKIKESLMREYLNAARVYYAELFKFHYYKSPDAGVGDFGEGNYNSGIMDVSKRMLSEHFGVGLDELKKEADNIAAEIKADYDSKY